MTSQHSGLLHYVERGNPEGPTIVFIHGWPDTDALFERQYDYFAPKFRLVCLQLPLYTPQSRPTASVGFFGYTLDEVRDFLIATIRHVSKGVPPVLVAHDWGCVLSYLALAKEPTLVRKLVALDIGQHSKPTPKGILILLAYQWTLMTAYILPSVVGNLLTRLVATVFHAPAAAKVHSGMNYLYCQTWKLLLTGKADSLRRWNPPSVPVLYLYGLNKPLFFHSPRWLAHCDSQKHGGGKVVPYNGGHWFFTSKKTAELVNREIEAFIAIK